MDTSLTNQGERDGGFTLIELLVVMIIIGILASIAIPTFLRQRQNAIGSGQVADLRAVADEVEGFYVNQDQYPDPATFVQAHGQVTFSTASGTGTQRVTVGNTMSYSLDPTATAYCLRAVNPKAAGPRVWISTQGGIQATTVTVCPW